MQNFGGMDFWAWTTGGPRLVGPPIPPFVIARGKYDNWLAHETIAKGARPVVDMSEVFFSLHVRHTHFGSYAPKSLALALAPEHNTRRQEVHNTSFYWSYGKLSNFEQFINIHLSLESV